MKSFRYPLLRLWLVFAYLLGALLAVNGGCEILGIQSPLATGLEPAAQIVAAIIFFLLAELVRMALNLEADINMLAREVEEHQAASAASPAAPPPPDQRKEPSF